MSLYGSTKDFYCAAWFESVSVLCAPYFMETDEDDDDNTDGVVHFFPRE